MNNSSASPGGHCDFSTAVQRFNVVLFIFIQATAVIGNTIILFLYKKHRVLRSTTNVFIISLSASDLIVVVLSMPICFGMFLCRYFPDEGSFIKNLTKLFDMLPSVLSIYSLSLVSVDRAVAVSHPFFHKKHFNQRLASIAVIVMWIMSTLIVALLFIISESEFTLLAILFAYVIPVVIMIFSYGIVGTVAKKHAKEINKLELTKKRFLQTDILMPRIDFGEAQLQIKDTDSKDSLLLNVINRDDSLPSLQDKILVPSTFHWLPTPRYQKKANLNISVRCLWREIKAALKLSFILSCFVMSWTPFMALNIQNYLYPDATIDLSLTMYFKILHYSNSTLNPLLYILLNKTWRAAFKMTIFCMGEKRMLALKNVAGW